MNTHHEEWIKKKLPIRKDAIVQEVYAITQLLHMHVIQYFICMIPDD